MKVKIVRWLLHTGTRNGVGGGDGDERTPCYAKGCQPRATGSCPSSWYVLFRRRQLQLRRAASAHVGGISSILKYKIRDFAKNNPNLLEKVRRDGLTLKLSGDGRRVTRQRSHFILTVAVMDEERRVFQPSYNYTVLLYEGTR